MKSKYLLLPFLALAFASCQEQVILSPYDKTDSTKPGTITVTDVKSTPGGALITYNLPDDEDLMYVKAKYTNTQGVEMESRASFYVDSLKISGIGDVEPRMVELRAVDRQENESDPVFQEITPGRPSVFKVADSFKCKADWGGFLLDYENIDSEEIGIYVVYENENTQGSTLHDVYYTSRPGGIIPVRGLEHVETEFGVYAEDKYGNISDTLKFTLTPWKETQLDKKLFHRITVLDDVSFDHYAGANERAWDGIYPGGWNFAHTADPVPFPHAMSIDLGVDVKLSRMRVWAYLGTDSDYYGHGLPRHYKIYGCKAADDPYKEESWVELLDTFINKPSGGEFGSPNTPDDIEEAHRGHEAAFPLDIEPIRYFRFQSLASWSGMKVTRIGEITLWGEVQE